MWKNPYYLYERNEVFVPSHLNFGEFMLSKLWENKERIAIINGETHEQLRYGEMAEQAMSLAISLTRIGVRKGDVVAICSENRQEFWSTVLGVICTGAMVTAMNFGYSRDEIKHAMNISKPKYVFCSPQAYKSHAKIFTTYGRVKKLIIFGDQRPEGVLSYNHLAKGISDGNSGRRPVEYKEFVAVDVESEDDPVFLLYSSGTTGMPKGVLLTHLNMLTICVEPDLRDENATTLMVTPWYHSMGLAGSLAHLASGRIMVYLSRFELNLYLKTIEEYKVFQIVVVPAILVAITKFPSDHDLSSVQLIRSGAAPLRSDTISAACSRFPNADTVRQGYGMTETTLTACKVPLNEKPKDGSVGKVNRGTMAKIVDIETRKPLNKFQEGEICLKGPLIMKGYVGKDRRDDFDDEGFFRTGDIAYYDEDGYIFVVGRLKELIKYKGHQVPPAEIEAVLLQHQGIRDAGVIGVPDDSAGEVPLAFVVTQPGVTLTENEVKQFVAEKLSSPKHLRGGVKFVTEIPKNPSGKILRNRLREMLKLRKSRL